MLKTLYMLKSRARCMLKGGRDTCLKAERVTCSIALRVLSSNLKMGFFSLSLTQKLCFDYKSQYFRSKNIPYFRKTAKKDPNKIMFYVLSENSKIYLTMANCSKNQLQNETWTIPILCYLFAADNLFISKHIDMES